MNIKKPILGILATPYISDNFKKKYIFLKNNILKILKENSIDHLIIPYTLNKTQLSQYLKNIDGLYLPGSQLGNFYSTTEFKKHFKTSKYLVKKIMKINKDKRILPILGICHGYENLMLIGEDIKLSKNILDNFFSTIYADNDYKTKLKLSKTAKNNKFLKNKLVFHNNSLGITPQRFKKTKKLKHIYNILATGIDKDNTIFIEAVKSIKYPFYGFQFHPELANKNFLQPFFMDVKKSFAERQENISLAKSLKFSPKKIKYKTLKCKLYQLSKNNHEKCLFYKV
tara:strand:- start:6878 stop:7729 length:852 start_codon:yes stop_codon:yes gene_type:complete